MNRKLRLATFVLALLLPLLAACGSPSTGQQEEPTPTPLPPDPAIERPTYKVQRGSIDRILQIWAQQRAQYAGQGDYLFGNFSIADAYFAPVVTRFLTYGVKVPPVCQVYMDAVMLHPAVAQWVRAAETEPEEEPIYEYIAVNE